MAKKLEPLPKLIKKADKVFSRWIRDRDTVDGLYIQTEEGLSIPCGYCFTCEKVTPVEGKETGDAGHFIKRGCKTLRYDETNVNLQCRRCNHYLSGNDGRYAVKLDIVYGKGTAERLHKIEDAYKRDGYKYTREELEALIKNYKEKK